MFQPSHHSDFPIVCFIYVFLVLEVNNLNLQRRAHVVIVAYSEAAIYRYISAGRGYNWSLIAMVTGENEKLVQGEVYQA